MLTVMCRRNQAAIDLRIGRSDNPKARAQPNKKAANKQGPLALSLTVSPLAL